MVCWGFGVTPLYGRLGWDDGGLAFVVVYRGRHLRFMVLKVKETGLVIHVNDSRTDPFYETRTGERVQ